jgi:sulfide:quinone oxidoreductase
MNEASSFRVLVGGGGVAGLEALLALRDLAGDRVELVFLDPAAEFVFRPMAVAEPFARGHVRRLAFTRIADDVGAIFLNERLTGVDHEHRRAVREDGDAIPYDALLVAVGASARPVYKRAITWTPEADAEVFGGLLRDLEEGYSKTVAFVVPPGVAWPLPAYELALMTAWQAKGMGQADLRVTVVTHEGAPLEAFGAAGSAAVRADLDDAGISVETDAYVEEHEGPPQRFVMQPGARVLDAQRVVALPRASGPAVRGLPSDELGFVRVDRNGAVPDTERVWAAGDATTFPVKQGGIAAQQADTAATAIAAVAGADVEPQPFHPVLRGVLLTGRGREWLRHDLTGGAGEPDAARHALWWPPTKVAGRYLSPYLQAFEEGDATGSMPEPSGKPVELDLTREP